MVSRDYVYLVAANTRRASMGWLSTKHIAYGIIIAASVTEFALAIFGRA
jgi:hypothetical protein